MRWISFFVFMVFSALCMGASCQGNELRTAMLESKMLGASALMSVYDNVYDYIETEAGTERICGHLLDEYRECFNSGECTEADLPRLEQELENDCREEIRAFEKKFDLALSSTSLALNQFENAISLWDKIVTEPGGKVVKGWKAMSMGEKTALVLECTNSIRDLMLFLEDAGVDVPPDLMSVLAFLTNIQDNL